MIFPTDFFDQITLNDQHMLYMSSSNTIFEVPPSHVEALWNLHPNHFHTLFIHGKKVLTPRWQQAFGKNYRYSGSKNNALPIPNELAHYLKWCQNHIDDRLNGMLLNWYDGQSDHYIGAHRDDTRDLITGTPIVTISLGEERIFRMRPWKSKGFKNITLRHGDIIIIPWETNLSWTHEVPSFKKYQGKRISITIRAFS